mmetsp:Transcript_3723/g.5613  ORF Transcript_3723/g.5613 Transcript_3723/m.5613 type:complete len:94 (+) Transcript_3723:354-635(+)
MLLARYIQAGNTYHGMKSQMDLEGLTITTGSKVVQVSDPHNTRNTAMVIVPSNDTSFEITDISSWQVQNMGNLAKVVTRSCIPEGQSCWLVIE